MSGELIDSAEREICACENYLVATARAVEAMPEQVILKQIPRYFLTQLGATMRQPRLDGVLAIGDVFYETVDNTDNLTQAPADKVLSPSESFMAMAGGLMGALKVVGSQHNQTLGTKGDVRGTDAIDTTIQEHATWGFAQKYFGGIREAHSWAHHLREVGDKIADEYPYSVAWYGSQFRSLAAGLDVAVGSMELLETTEPLDRAETEALHETNNELFAATRRLQKYGVKPAIAPAISDSAAVSEWLFQPVDVIRNLNVNNGENNAKHEIGRGMLLDNALAVILSANRSFNTSKPSATSLGIGKRSGLAMRGFSSEDLLTDGEYSNDLIIGSLQITRDGKIHTIWGLDLELFCEINDCSYAYEQLRSELLTIYFDLVTPVYVQDVVDQELAASNPANPSMESQGAKLKRLAVARTLVLNTLGDEVEEAIKHEDNQDKINTVLRITDRHDVTEHIRRIKPTFRAGQEARDHCFEDLGIVLAEYGETYVRKHERGSRETDSKGHKIAYQAGSLAVKKSSAATHKRPRKSGRYTPPKNQR